LESVQNLFKIVQSEKSVKIRKTKTKNENEKTKQKTKNRKLIKKRSTDTKPARTYGKPVGMF
jgi:hypothetical protein